MKRYNLGVWATFLLTGAACGQAGAVISVCPEGYVQDACDFTGHNAIQQAVDVAGENDIIQVKSGVYKPTVYRDVPFDEPTDTGVRHVVVRGAIVIENKGTSIVGGEDVILQPDAGVPATAFVVHDGALSLEGVHIEGFRVHEPEDPIYDGHGIFVIDSSVTLQNVRVHDVEKMALVIRGKSAVSAMSVHLSNSHMGVWFEEEGALSLSGAVLSGNHTGLGVYGNTTSSVSDTVIEGSTDDGIYAIGNARVSLSDTTIRGNAPYGINVRDNVTLDFASGVFEDNTTDVSEIPVASTVTIADSVRR